MNERTKTLLIWLAAFILAALAVYVWWSSPVFAHEAIPWEAQKWQRTLLREVRFTWGLETEPAPFFGQVHQESRWKTTARSVFAAGLAQFTPGTAAGMQKGYNQDLRELCEAAGGCPLDGHWALRAMVLYDRELWRRYDMIRPWGERFSFTLASYNAGPGWIRKEQAAAKTQGKNPNQWFSSVETVCVRAPHFCDETRGYVRLIMTRWTPLYRDWLRR